MPELLSIANFIDKKPQIRYFEGKEGLKEIFKDTLNYPNQEILAWFPRTFEKFIDEYPEYKDSKKFDQKLFTKYLKLYARYTKGINDILIERKTGNLRYFKFLPENE